MNVEELVEKLDAMMDEAVSALADVERQEDAIQVKNRYLGRKGQVQDVMKFLRDLPNEGKRAVGQASNKAKQAIESAYEQRLESLKALELAARLQREALDVTLPGRPVRFTKGHPLQTVAQELTDIFLDMGFEVADGPEIEDDRYNFEALNFPADHPARDMQDTFLTRDGRLLRTHTSPVQVRTMLAYEPPIRVISPGRVYRCDNDVTHSPVFHQIEGLLIDKNVTFRDLKGTLTHFVHTFYGVDTPVRLRPSFFPFTEPSAEVDIGCIFCDGDGCRVCSHTGWLEILGCGMVDPNVLRDADIDPDVYSGFAFGMGVERIAMLKLGISDIRLFFENDLRFLEQF